MTKHEDGPLIWNGGGFCRGSKFRFLMLLVLGYIRAEKKKK